MSLEPQTFSRSVRTEDLGRFIREKRRRDKITLVQAAQQSGVSIATLSRLERNSDTEPDTKTLSALIRWLNVSIERITTFDQPSPVDSVIHHEGDTLPDIVTAHLRADRNLDTRTAKALANMFKAAYEQFADLTQETVDKEQTTSHLSE